MLRQKSIIIQSIVVVFCAVKYFTKKSFELCKVSVTVGNLTQKSTGSSEPVWEQS